MKPLIYSVLPAGGGENRIKSAIKQANRMIPEVPLIENLSGFQEAVLIRGSLYFFAPGSGFLLWAVGNYFGGQTTGHIFPESHQFCTPFLRGRAVPSPGSSFLPAVGDIGG